MQVVEVIVFISIAVIIGSIMVGFITHWDVEETYDDISEVIFDKENNVEFSKVGTEEFIIKLYESWKDCGFGEFEKNYAYYVKQDDPSEDELTKEMIFEKLKMLNWCLSIQSEDYDCGDGEDVEMDDDIELPALVILECSDDQITISTE